MKPRINDKLTVKPAPRDNAYFSYRGYGLSINIGDGTIDDVFEEAKKAFKATMEKEEIIDDRSQKQKREALRVKDAEGRTKPAKPVARKRKARKVAPVLPGPKKSDIR